MKKIREYFLYLVIFLIPWQARYFFVQAEIGGQYWEYGSFFLYITEILLILLLVTVLTEKPKKHDQIQHILLSLIVVMPLLGILAAEGLRLAIHGYAHWIVAASLIVIITRLGQNKTKILTALVLSGLAQASLVLWQVYDQRVFASTLLGMAAQHPGTLGVIVIETVTQRFLRAYGSLPHPNILGGFLALTFLAAMNLYITSKQKSIYYLSFAALPIITIALFFTLSRSAVLGSIAGLAVMYIYSERKTSIKKALIAPLIILGILTVTLLPFITTRLGLAPSRIENQSISLRGNYTIDSFLVIGTFPWTGVGIGNYTLFMYHLFPLLEPWEYQPVHSIYLLSAAEWGFFQAVIFWSALLYILYINRKSPFAPMLATLLIIGLFDHYLLTNHTGRLLLFLSIGLLLAKKE